MHLGSQIIGALGLAERIEALRVPGAPSQIAPSWAALVLCNWTMRRGMFSLPSLPTATPLA